MTKHSKDWNQFNKEFHKQEMASDEDIEFSDMDSQGSEEDEEGGGSKTLDYPSHTDLESALTQAEQKAHEHWEKLVRTTAELDNLRRRMEREVSNAHKYAVEKLLCELLPIIDALETALRELQAREKAKDHLSVHDEGMELIMKLFLDVFGKFNVKAIDPLGLAFDPQQHEAICLQEAEGPANTVLQVVQKGYLLNDRVIRPARVIVSKNKA